MSNIEGRAADLPGIGRVTFEAVGNTAYSTGFRGTVLTPDGHKAQFRAATVLDDSLRVAFVVDSCDPSIARSVAGIESHIARVMSEPRNEVSLFFCVHDRAQMDSKAMKRVVKEIDSRLQGMLREHHRGSTLKGEPTTITREALERENERVSRLGRPLLDRIAQLESLAADLSKWSHGDKTRTVADILKAHEREIGLPLPQAEGIAIPDALATAASEACAVALPPASPHTVLGDIALPGRNVFYVTDGRGHTINVERADRLDGLDWQKTVPVHGLWVGWPFEEDSEYKKKVTDGDILLFDCPQPSAQALDRLCSAVARHGKDVIVVGFAPEATYVGTSSAILEALKAPVAEAEMAFPAP